jgi:hypothetical protein
MPPATTTSDHAAPLPPLRLEVALLMPWALAVGLLRETVAAARASIAALEPMLHDTVMLFPRIVVAAEGIASVAPAIEELARTKPSIDRLAEATVTLERLAAATDALDQLAETGLTLQRIAETSGQIEKLANATVVAPLQGTAERFGRIVAGFPGNPRRAAARFAGGSANGGNGRHARATPKPSPTPSAEANAKRRGGRSAQPSPKPSGGRSAG